MHPNPPEVLEQELKRAQTEADTSAALEHAYLAIDQLHDRYVGMNWIHLDCKQNCFWCCYLRVDAKAHEIFAIAHHVQTKFTVEELDALLKRLRQHRDRVAKLTFVEHMATNVECPLLVNGSCTVYPVRPFGCRRHHLMRVKACEDSFNNPTDLEYPGARHLGLFGTMVQAEQSLYTVFAANGYDQTAYELGTALLEALTDQKSWHRWKKKKKAFVRAVRAPATPQDDR